ncbi:hypothetical protein [Streptococcus sp. LYSM12]|uniref:hypothetical protein n=1 Tax=unclassified Streptococcus TaxID=2608887 RepID=UPI0014301956|nr:hypothetical protein [Streptococcus sp. LYSM12]MCQ9212997.1 hypothetical protein [Streptococcus sp. O1]
MSYYKEYRCSSSKLLQLYGYRIVLYTTDFECTIRDNGDWLIDIDLDNSTVSMPHE